MNHAPTPTPATVKTPTLADVRANPDYYLAHNGPGRDAARNAYCAHDYRLTDSCPCC